MLVSAVREEIYLDLDSESLDDDVGEQQISSYDHLTHEEAVKQRQEWIQQLKTLAKTSSTDPEAVRQAESIFDTMFQAYITSEDGAVFWPDIEVYNYLLEAHAFAVDRKSRSGNKKGNKEESNLEYNGAEAAEMLLERMEDPDNEMIVRPNAESYSRVMDAWAVRSQPQKVREVLRRQIKRWQDLDEGTVDDDDDKSSSSPTSSLRPTTDSFNKLIKAWGIAGDIDRATKLFHQMVDTATWESNDDKDDDDDWISPSDFGIKADQKTWVQLMKAYLGNGREEQVEGLFNTMAERYMNGNEVYKPQTAAYNQLIRSTQDPKRAETLLFEMIGKRDPDTTPNSETFRQVLSTYSNDIRSSRNNKQPTTIPLNILAAKVEQLIQIQYGLYQTNGESEDLRFDDRLCQVALNVIARSLDSKKASIGKRVFDRFKSQTKLSTKSYYNLLMACAYTKGKTEDKFEAFQIVREAVKELQTSPHLTFDSGCTGMYLKALSNLMPSGSKRDKVAETVFNLCADAGYVNDFVLEQFGITASPTTQLQVLGGFAEDEPTIPRRWKRNV